MSSFIAAGRSPPKEDVAHVEKPYPQAASSRPPRSRDSEQKGTERFFARPIVSPGAAGGASSKVDHALTGKNEQHQPRRHYSSASSTASAASNRTARSGPPSTWQDVEVITRPSTVPAVSSSASSSSSRSSISPSKQQVVQGLVNKQAAAPSRQKLQTNASTVDSGSVLHQIQQGDETKARPDLDLVKNRPTRTTGGPNNEDGEHDDAAVNVRALRAFGSGRQSSVLSNKLRSSINTLNTLRKSTIPDVSSSSSCESYDGTSSSASGSKGTSAPAVDHFFCDKAKSDGLFGARDERRSATTKPFLLGEPAAKAPASLDGNNTRNSGAADAPQGQGQVTKADGGKKNRAQDDRGRITVQLNVKQAAAAAANEEKNVENIAEPSKPAPVVFEALVQDEEEDGPLPVLQQEQKVKMEAHAIVTEAMSRSTERTEKAQEDVAMINRSSSEEAEKNKEGSGAEATATPAEANVSDGPPRARPIRLPDLLPKLNVLRYFKSISKQRERDLFVEDLHAADGREGDTSTEPALAAGTITGSENKDIASGALAPASISLNEHVEARPTLQLDGTAVLVDKPLQVVADDDAQMQKAIKPAVLLENFPRPASNIAEMRKTRLAAAAHQIRSSAAVLKRMRSSSGTGSSSGSSFSSTTGGAKDTRQKLRIWVNTTGASRAARVPEVATGKVLGSGVESGTVPVGRSSGDEPAGAATGATATAQITKIEATAVGHEDNSETTRTQNKRPSASVISMSSSTTLTEQLLQAAGAPIVPIRPALPQVFQAEAKRAVLPPTATLVAPAIVPKRPVAPMTILGLGTGLGAATGGSTSASSGRAAINPSAGCTTDVADDFRRTLLQSASRAKKPKIIPPRPAKAPQILAPPPLQEERGYVAAKLLQTKTLPVVWTAPTTPVAAAGGTRVAAALPKSAMLMSSSVGGPAATSTGNRSASPVSKIMFSPAKMRAAPAPSCSAASGAQSGAAGATTSFVPPTAPKLFAPASSPLQAGLFLPARGATVARATGTAAPMRVFDPGTSSAFLSSASSTSTGTSFLRPFDARQEQQPPQKSQTPPHLDTELARQFRLSLVPVHLPPPEKLPSKLSHKQVVTESVQKHLQVELERMKSRKKRIATEKSFFDLLYLGKLREMQEGAEVKNAALRRKIQRAKQDFADEVTEQIDRLRKFLLYSKDSWRSHDALVVKRNKKGPPGDDEETVLLQEHERYRLEEDETSSEEQEAEESQSSSLISATESKATRKSQLGKSSKMSCLTSSSSEQEKPVAVPDAAENDLDSPDAPAGAEGEEAGGEDEEVEGQHESGAPGAPKRPSKDSSGPPVSSAVHSPSEMAPSSPRDHAEQETPLPEDGGEANAAQLEPGSALSQVEGTEAGSAQSVSEAAVGGQALLSETAAVSNGTRSSTSAQHHSAVLKAAVKTSRLERVKGRENNKPKGGRLGRVGQEQQDGSLEAEQQPAQPRQQMLFYPEPEDGVDDKAGSASSADRTTKPMKSPSGRDGRKLPKRKPVKPKRNSDLQEAAKGIRQVDPSLDNSKMIHLPILEKKTDLKLAVEQSPGHQTKITAGKSDQVRHAAEQALAEAEERFGKIFYKAKFVVEEVDYAQEKEEEERHREHQGMKTASSANRDPRQYYLARRWQQFEEEVFKPCREERLKIHRETKHAAAVVKLARVLHFVTRDQLQHSFFQVAGMPQAAALFTEVEKDWLSQKKAKLRSEVQQEELTLLKRNKVRALTTTLHNCLVRKILAAAFFRLRYHTACRVTTASTGARTSAVASTSQKQDEALAAEGGPTGAPLAVPGSSSELDLLVDSDFDVKVSSGAAGKLLLAAGKRTTAESGDAPLDVLDTADSNSTKQAVVLAPAAKPLRQSRSSDVIVFSDDSPRGAGVLPMAELLEEPPAFRANEAATTTEPRVLVFDAATAADEQLGNDLAGNLGESASAPQRWSDRVLDFFGVSTALKDENTRAHAPSREDQIALPTVAVPSEAVPAATHHQSQLQLHNRLHVHESQRETVGGQETKFENSAAEAVEEQAEPSILFYPEALPLTSQPEEDAVEDLTSFSLPGTKVTTLAGMENREKHYKQNSFPNGLKLPPKPRILTVSKKM
ncbi:unnamed protein product [Amoebophrya sp. A120]|nr:unnamed protein product [Amoebophrya sp. A120]|eukprot:GSA120T00017277001.1